MRLKAWRKKRAGGHKNRHPGRRAAATSAEATGRTGTAFRLTRTMVA
jgi:hypothetical protein